MNLLANWYTLAFECCKYEGYCFHSGSESLCLQPYEKYYFGKIAYNICTYILIG